VNSAAAPPTLSLPSGLSADATSAAGDLLNYKARAMRATGGNIAVDCEPPPGAQFPIGVTEVLCSAVDPTTEAVAVGAFPVTIVDGPPAVNVPANILMVTAQTILGAVVSYQATATDAVSGPLPVECVPPSGTLFPLLDSTVVCQATDGAGNTASASFVVRVKLKVLGIGLP
jgi:hypothetical protein